MKGDDEVLRYGSFIELPTRSYVGHCSVNLDQVRKYEYLEGKRVKVWWANGEEEVFGVDGRIVPENYYIIPATPGFELLMYWPEAEDEFTSEHREVLERTPVVAWRVEEYRGRFLEIDESIIAISINMTSAEESVRVAVRHPDGVVSRYADCRL